MRKRLFDIIVCPACKAELSEAGDRLSCPKCAKSYEVRSGVPVMLPEAMVRDSDTIATKRMFSFAWKRFARDEASKSWFKDSFTYMSYVPQGLFSAAAGKIGLDVGCGSGVDMISMNRKGFEMVGIDISDAAYEASANTRDIEKVHVVQASVYDMPLKDNFFDLGYSFGVLHHLPRPEEGFKRLCDKVKRGGSVIIYVYEDFAERSALERALLKAVNSLRVVTKRLPPPVLYSLCVLASPFVLLSCSLPYQIFKRIPATRKFAERIPFRHTVRLDCIVADLYDRFSPPIERRYNRQEVEAWFRKAGFEDINVINHRGWVAWGRKR